MRRMAGLGLGMWVMLALAGCAPPVTGGSDAPASLAGTEWQLTELTGRAPVAGVTVPTLQFSGDQVRGDGGCNQFFGPYVLNGGSIQMGPIGATRRACGEEAGNRQETDYFQALDSATRVSVSAGVLTLYVGEQVVARFQRIGG